MFSSCAAVGVAVQTGWAPRPGWHLPQVFQLPSVLMQYAFIALVALPCKVPGLLVLSDATPCHW